LTAKQHFLTHYHRLIAASGPTGENQHICFEAFHQQFKTLIAALLNFLNVSRSIGNHFRECLAANLNNGTYRLKEAVTYKIPQKKKLVLSIEQLSNDDRELVLKEFGPNDPTMIYAVNSVVAFGTKYSKKQYVMYDAVLDGEKKPILPCFGLIQRIYVIARQFGVFYVPTNIR
jgi:hypothetical protein